MEPTQLPTKTSAVLVYGRPFLIFAGLVCALVVMWNRNPSIYLLGVLFLLLSMMFDLIDAWFAARYRPQSPLASLADRIMDKMVYSIIFPVVAVGAMWRLLVVQPSRAQMLHAIFLLMLCVTVLVRDNFAGFMRSFAQRPEIEPESRAFSRLRTIAAAPIGALLYGYVFYVPQDPSSWFYGWFTWLEHLPLRTLIFIEIGFLVINFGSIAAYCRKYGSACLDEISLGDPTIRCRILSVFPNALTVMNAIMGLIGVFFAYQGRFREMYFMLIGAATFDKLDGAVARRLGLTDRPENTRKKRSINMGNLMDDFADGVSFCIAPAWIYFLALTAFGIEKLGAVPIMWISMLYALAGIMRLVYFTVDKNPIPGFFKGLPTPAAALLVLSPIVICEWAATEMPEQIAFWGHFATWTMIFSALIMNFYPIRYIHIGRAMSRHTWFGRLTMLFVVFCVFSPYLGQVSLGFMLLYVLSPLATWRVQPQVAAREQSR